MEGGAGGLRAQRLVDGRLHDGAVELDGLHDLVVGQGADAQLQAEAVVLEPLVLHQDLVDDLLGRTHEVGAGGTCTGFELGTGSGRPAALLADTAHRLVVGGEGDVERVLRVLGDEAVRGDADGEFGAVVADLVGGAAVELGEGFELLRVAADDGEHQGQAVIGGAGDGVRRAADGDPEGQGRLHGLGINGDAGDGLGVLGAGPIHLPAFADLDQLGELLLEEGVVVLELVAEEGEAFDETAAARHDLGAAVGEQVERSKLLPDADRVFGGEYRDGGREADVLRQRGGGGEDGDRGRGDEIGTVVLAQPVEIEADLIGEADFLEEVLEALGRGLQVTVVERVGGVLGERVEADFHGVVLAKWFAR